MGNANVFQFRQTHCEHDHRITVHLELVEGFNQNFLKDFLESNAEITAGS